MYIFCAKRKHGIWYCQELIAEKYIYWSSLAIWGHCKGGGVGWAGGGGAILIL